MIKPLFTLVIRRQSREFAKRCTLRKREFMKQRDLARARARHSILRELSLSLVRVRRDARDYECDYTRARARDRQSMLPKTGEKIEFRYCIAARTDIGLATMELPIYINGLIRVIRII